MHSLLAGTSFPQHGWLMSDEREIIEQDHEYDCVHEDLYQCTILWGGREIEGVHVMAKWGTKVTASTEEAALAQFDKLVEQAYADGPPEGSDIFLAMDDDYAGIGIPRDHDSLPFKPGSMFNLGAGGDSWVWKIDGVEV